MMSLQFLSPMHPDDDVYTFSHSTSRLFFLSSFDDLYMLKTRVIKLLFRFFFFEGGARKRSSLSDVRVVVVQSGKSVLRQEFFLWEQTKDFIITSILT